jgi:hypothetical protein
MPSVKLCAVFLTACAIAGPASPRARADFIPNFTGNVQMSDHSGSPSTPQGVVSFTVFANPGSNFLTTLGLSATNLTSASIDVGAKYIYMYQAYASAGPIEQLQITASPGLFTSAGYLTNTVFVDSAGNVGTSSNKALGSEPNKDDPTIDGNPATVNSGSDHSGFKNQSLLTFGVNSAGRTPGSADLSADTGFAGFSFTGTANKISSGQTSVVVFLTSNFAPQYDAGQIHDGGLSNGDVPTAVTPEPGSFVLCGLGVGLLGFYGWRRRGLNAQPAVA